MDLPAGIAINAHNTLTSSTKPDSVPGVVFDPVTAITFDVRQSVGSGLFAAVRGWFMHPPVAPWEYKPTRIKMHGRKIIADGRWSLPTSHFLPVRDDVLANTSLPMLLRYWETIKSQCAGIDILPLVSCAPWTVNQITLHFSYHKQILASYYTFDATGVTACDMSGDDVLLDEANIKDEFDNLADSLWHDEDVIALQNKAGTKRLVGLVDDFTRTCTGEHRITIHRCTQRSADRFATADQALRRAVNDLMVAAGLPRGATLIDDLRLVTAHLLLQPGGTAEKALGEHFSTPQ